MRCNLLLQTLAVGLLVTVLYVSPALTQWSTNPNTNNAICTAVIYQQNPTIVSDGLGGVIITWLDTRGVDPHIYAQRVNASGAVQWTADGVPICMSYSSRNSPIIVSDGSGGAIITWVDWRSNGNIYAQRVNSLGAVQWTTDGVAIYAAGNSQVNPNIVSDGSGGAIITWQDPRSGNLDIFAQRVNSSGTPLWTTGGVAVCAETHDQESPTIVPDGSGGAIITWQDLRNGNLDIFAQRVDASGNPQWTTNGVAICAATHNQQYPTIVSDGSGGAIITWWDYRSNTNWDIYAQRVNSSGAVQWTTDGVGIDTLTGDQAYPCIVSDGSGGAIITWQDYRSGNYDIYSQRVNSSGLAQWTANGAAVCTAIGNKTLPTIVSDGSGGAIITWQDPRNGYLDVYAQRMNASGTPYWTTNGVAICTATGDQAYPCIVSDGSGGAIITWQDSRRGFNSHIYAQQVDRFGYLGNAAPSIVKVKDVMNDQGGKVAVMWNPSYLDVYPNPGIAEYAVYRGLKPSAANQSYAVLDPDKYSKWENSAGGKGKAYLRLPLSPASTETIYWENVGSVNAEALEGYSYNVTTLSDSGPQGVPMYYLMVRAESYSSYVYWNSSPDSGYSVDNLPPITPQNAAILPMVNGSINIHWNPDKIDPDVGHFSVYRSTSSGFLLNDGTRLQTTVDTTVTDSTTEIGQQYYYKVTAVDIHGNESQPTAELHTAALSVQLASMTATTLATGVQLDWTTVSETNNLGFYVERRPQNTGAYATVSDLIPGAGTSLQQHHYQWTDTKVTDGNYNYRLRLVDLGGNTTYSSAITVTVSGVSGVNGSLPTEFALQQNYPNPFNPTTVISYQLPIAGYVTLKVYDMLGQEVATLVNGAQDAGDKSVEFSAGNLPSGIYTYRLTAGTFVEVKKMLMLK